MKTKKEHREIIKTMGDKGREFIMEMMKNDLSNTEMLGVLTTLEHSILYSTIMGEIKKK